MATYLDTLMADRDRLLRALNGQIEAEAARVRELQARVAQYADALDQEIIRLMMVRGLYGGSSQEVFAAQTEVEEASRPHTAALGELAQHQRLLQALQEALIRLNQGQPLEPNDAGGAGKLTVADILEA